MRRSGTGQERKAAEKKRLDGILSSVPDREQRAVTDLLEYLFPPLEAITQNSHYDSDWQTTWTREKRVVSEEYFDRYFQYAISANDVSDVAVDRFLDQMGNSDSARASQLLAALITPESAERIVAKLRARELEIAPEVARNLIPLLARAGSILPGETSFMSFATPFGQAAFLINALIRRLPQPEREASATDAVSVAAPLSFALGVWRAIRRPSESPPETATLSEDAELRLKEAVREQVRLEAKREPFYRRPRGQSLTLLSAWQFFFSKEETQPLLVQDFEQNPASAALFVASLIPTAWDVASGLPFESELDREHYDLIGRLIDHETLLSSLRLAYPDLSAPPHYPTRAEVADPLLRAAQGYTYLHKIISERMPPLASSSEPSPPVSPDGDAENSSVDNGRVI